MSACAGQWQAFANGGSHVLGLTAHGENGNYSNPDLAPFTLMPFFSLSSAYAAEQGTNNVGNVIFTFTLRSSSRGIYRT